MVHSTIKKTLALLSKETFIQIHRSYIVAMSWIDKIEDNHVYVGAEKIPIGATYRMDFLELLNRLNF